jgi:hypothetical protein
VIITVIIIEIVNETVIVKDVNAAIVNVGNGIVVIALSANRVTVNSVTVNRVNVTAREKIEIGTRSVIGMAKIDVKSVVGQTRKTMTGTLIIYL